MPINKKMTLAAIVNTGDVIKESIVESIVAVKSAKNPTEKFVAALIRYGSPSKKPAKAKRTAKTCAISAAPLGIF